MQCIFRSWVIISLDNFMVLVALNWASLPSLPVSAMSLTPTNSLHNLSPSYSVRLSKPYFLIACFRNVNSSILILSVIVFLVAILFYFFMFLFISEPLFYLLVSFRLYEFPISNMILSCFTHFKSCIWKKLAACWKVHVFVIAHTFLVSQIPSVVD